jgi:hypothetical protein
MQKPHPTACFFLTYLAESSGAAIIGVNLQDLPGNGTKRQTP